MNMLLVSTCLLLTGAVAAHHQARVAHRGPTQGEGCLASSRAEGKGLHGWEMAGGVVARNLPKP